MYILKRTISPYTGSELLLGCFRDFREARATRDSYIRQYENNQKEDPWKGQAFHDVDLEKDVVIVDNIAEYHIRPNASTVIIVSSFSEGFGQELREFHAICGSDKAAQTRIAKIRKSTQGQWPRFFSTQQIVLNKLLSDEKDRTDARVHAKTVDKLKKNKKYREAEKLLVGLIAESEKQSELDGLGVPDWYYFELAKLYRRQKNYSEEVAILEKSLKSMHETEAMAKLLLERLNRAKELLAAKQGTSR